MFFFVVILFRSLEYRNTLTSNIVLILQHDWDFRDYEIELMFHTQYGEYADPIVQWEGKQEKASLQLDVVQRGNPLGKNGKGLSWQGEEHAKLEMRKFRDRDNDRNHSSIPLLYWEFLTIFTLHSNLSTIIGPTRLHS